MSVPRESAEWIVRRFGDDGRRFLAELPDRLTAAARRWDLRLQDPLPMGIGGYLTADGGRAVLKLSPDPVELAPGGDERLVVQGVETRTGSTCRSTPTASSATATSTRATCSHRPSSSARAGSSRPTRCAGGTAEAPSGCWRPRR